MGRTLTAALLTVSVLFSFPVPVTAAELALQEELIETTAIPLEEAPETVLADSEIALKTFIEENLGAAIEEQAAETWTEPDVSPEMPWDPIPYEENPDNGVSEWESLPDPEPSPATEALTGDPLVSMEADGSAEKIPAQPLYQTPPPPEAAPLPYLLQIVLGSHTAQETFEGLRNHFGIGGMVGLPSEDNRGWILYAYPEDGTEVLVGPTGQSSISFKFQDGMGMTAHYENGQIVLIELWKETEESPRGTVLTLTSNMYEKLLEFLGIYETSAVKEPSETLTVPDVDALIDELLPMEESPEEATGTGEDILPEESDNWMPGIETLLGQTVEAPPEEEKNPSLFVSLADPADPPELPIRADRPFGPSRYAGLTPDQNVPANARDAALSLGLQNHYRRLTVGEILGTGELYADAGNQVQAHVRLLPNGVSTLFFNDRGGRVHVVYSREGRISFMSRLTEVDDRFVETETYGTRPANEEGYSPATTAFGPARFPSLNGARNAHEALRNLDLDLQTAVRIEVPAEEERAAGGHIDVYRDVRAYIYVRGGVSTLTFRTNRGGSVRIVYENQAVRFMSYSRNGVELETFGSRPGGEEVRVGGPFGPENYPDLRDAGDAHNAVGRLGLWTRDVTRTTRLLNEPNGRGIVDVFRDFRNGTTQPIHAIVHAQNGRSSLSFYSPGGDRIRAVYENQTLIFMSRSAKIQGSWVELSRWGNRPAGETAPAVPWAGQAPLGPPENRYPSLRDTANAGQALGAMSLGGVGPPQIFDLPREENGRPARRLSIYPDGTQLEERSDGTSLLTFNTGNEQIRIVYRNGVIAFMARFVQDVHGRWIEIETYGTRPPV